MSSFVLKIIAIISMLIDHSGYVIYGQSSWMNIIGRVAFPIFAWQIVQGFIHTKNIKLYLYRLIVLAMISQLVYYLFFSTLTNQVVLNVIFTLSLSLICLLVLNKNKRIGIVFGIFACIFATYFNLEYGSYGIIMVIIFYLYKDNKYLMVFMQIMNLLIYYLNTQSIIQLFSILGVLLILLYNGKKGKNVKYLFYVFYPLHLLVLYYLQIM